jgi:hypothetical protein
MTRKKNQSPGRQMKGHYPARRNKKMRKNERNIRDFSSLVRNTERQRQRENLKSKRSKSSHGRDL